MNKINEFVDWKASGIAGLNKLQRFNLEQIDAQIEKAANRAAMQKSVRYQKAYRQLVNLFENKPNDVIWSYQQKQGKWVACYLVVQEYGGPEEGGWWYDSRELIWCKKFGTIQERNQALKSIVPAYIGHRVWEEDRHLVNSRGTTELIVVDSEPAPYYPIKRPHYE